MPADRHRLGENPELRGEPVRDRQHQRLLDHDLFRVGAGGGGGEPDRVHLVAAPAKRQRHDRRARRQLPLAPGPVVGDLARELVAEHDPLVGAHEAVVAGLREHVGLLVGVVARVKIGAADPAARDVDEHLALGGLGCRQVDFLEPRALAGDGLQAASPVIPAAGCRRTAAAA